MISQCGSLASSQAPHSAILCKLSSEEKERIAMTKYKAITPILNRMQEVYAKNMLSFVRRLGQNIRNGQEPAGLLLKRELVKSLIEIKRPGSYQAATIGYRWGELLVSQVNKEEEELDGELIAAIEDRLEYMSEKESETFLEKVALIILALLSIRVLRNEGGSATRALTALEIADRFIKDMAKFVANYAGVVASAMTVWAENEGTQHAFIRAGVEANEWVAVADDRTCPFCMDMDGTIVASGAAFLGPLEELNVGGKVLRGFDLPTIHPPVHPRCRCTLIPVTI